MELIYTIDTILFHIINRGLSNPLFDFIMPFFHHEKYLVPIVILLFLITIIYDKPNRLKLLFLIPIAIILVDQTGLFIKNFFLRPRPWVTLESTIIHLLVTPHGANLSFPSNHAANSAVLATIFSAIYYNVRFIFWGIAITVMLSRVYIGVHYPIDILFGCILGAIYGVLLIKAWGYFNKLLK